MKHLKFLILTLLFCFLTNISIAAETPSPTTTTTPTPAPAAEPEAPASQPAMTVPTPKANMNIAPLRDMVILEGGRQKPFDTFARETARELTGRERFEGFDPVELMISWITHSDAWEEFPLLLCHYRPLQDQVHFKLNNGRISPKELKNHQEFNLFLQTVAAKQAEKKALSELEKEAAMLNSKMQRFYRIAEGSSLVMIPGEKNWESLSELSRRYPLVSIKEAVPNAETKLAVGFQELFRSYYQDDAKSFQEVGSLLPQVLREKAGKTDYLSEKNVKREVHFNQFKPFRWAWVLYAIAFFILLLSLKNSKIVYRIGIIVLLAAFALHTYGFILRIFISGRAPVTNMYETVLWVPYGMVVFALILEAVYRSRYILIGASVLAGLALILTENAPHVLDPSIDPLVPVLRDNFWLTTHVLSITLSYGAFSLALALANINLGFYLFAPGRKQTIQALTQWIYRAIQIGVVFLAAGTILGGVWANSSWGRFWGWDPKEVWALIALLGYLALLHARFIGWIRPFGLSVGSIISYLLVLMAWYGVNFILGVGLHSYGFSSGGAKFMGVFVGIELLWVLIVSLVRWKRESSHEKTTLASAN